MSKELKTIGNTSVTQFNGGLRGVCIQLTKINEDGKAEYVQLTPYEMSKLIPVFKKIIRKNLPR